MTIRRPQIVAVIDETAPADRRGIYYVVTAGLLFDVDRIRAGLDSVIPGGRKRPFHWATEGSRSRERMLELIIDTGVVAHVVVHYPTGRRRQEEARRAAIGELLPLVVAEGADELIIESRSNREDQRDRESVIEALHRTDPGILYRWENKTEPLLWVADALCGMVKEYVLGEDTATFERLQATNVVDQLRYRSLGGQT